MGKRFDSAYDIRSVGTPRGTVEPVEPVRQRGLSRQRPPTDLLGGGPRVEQPRIEETFADVDVAPGLRQRVALRRNEGQRPCVLVQMVSVQKTSTILIHLDEVPFVAEACALASGPNDGSVYVTGSIILPDARFDVAAIPGRWPSVTFALIGNDGAARGRPRRVSGAALEGLARACSECLKLGETT